MFILLKTSFIEISFWLSFLIVFYNYIGYGIILIIILKVKKVIIGKKQYKENDFFKPIVTLLIAAYNEEEFIEGKIKNALELDYPEDKLDIIIVTDGSTDRTPSICRLYPRIKLMHEDTRKGKIAAINRAMKHVKTEVVIFNDANTILNKNAVNNLIKHYQNEQVGGVSGEKRILTSIKDTAVGSGEGFYWKYESFLKRLDSELYSVVGAAGELFSIRTKLYEKIEENIILDDFIISLRINAKGYRIIYEPNAIAMETPSMSMEDEYKRKVRICAGGIQSIFKLIKIMNFFRYGILTFQYVSHRVLRWTFSPIALFSLFFLNLFLVFTDNHLYLSFFLIQILFYFLAGVGWIYAKREIKIKLFYIPYYFLFMNIAVFQGFFRFVRGKQSAIWEKASRKNMVS